MKKVFKKINTVISWLFCIAMVLCLVVSMLQIANRNSTEPKYIFGYRPICLTSGSMEPTIKTNALAIGKKVNSMKDIQEGDIVSFHITDNDGTEYKITHRIYDIDENTGFIMTKGDNNEVTDSTLLTINNVESKVCLIMNWTAGFGVFWKKYISDKEIYIGVGVLIISILLIVISSIKNRKKKE